MRTKKGRFAEALVGLFRSLLVAVWWTWWVLFGAGTISTTLAGVPELTDHPLAQLTISYTGGVVTFAFWFAWEYPVIALFILLALTTLHWSVVDAGNRNERMIVDRARQEARKVVRKKKRQRTGRRK